AVVRAVRAVQRRPPRRAPPVGRATLPPLPQPPSALGPGGEGSSSWWRRRRTLWAPAVRRHRRRRESAPRPSSWVAVNNWRAAGSVRVGLPLAYESAVPAQDR